MEARSFGVVKVEVDTYIRWIRGLRVMRNWHRGKDEASDRLTVTILNGGAGLRGSNALL